MKVVPTVAEEGIEIPWFAVPVYTEDEVEMYSIGRGEKEKEVQEKIVKPDLPQDPRHWSRADVCDWVIWMCSNHHLPNPDIDRSVRGLSVWAFHNVEISQVPDEREGRVSHVRADVLQQSSSGGQTSIQRLPDKTGKSLVQKITNYSALT